MAKLESVGFYEHVVTLPKPRANAAGYGIAIDIGTTTHAFELLNLQTGECTARFSSGNSQRIYGADIISRIAKAGEGEAERLNALLMQDINEGVAALLSQAGSKTGTTDETMDMPPQIAITGNTTMLHFLQNLPTHGLGVYPFTPVSVAPAHTTIAELPAIILPCVSAFIGADMVAGILHCGWAFQSGYNLLIDLGTNGEIALFSQEKVLATSTAAGPAFEGGNISAGVPSVAGGIANAKISPEKNVFSVETIENKPPIGICGTGVIDIAAELVKHGIADETGLLSQPEITICPGISFTQADLREVQLAKAAVRAAIEILLDEAAITHHDVENVFLAGGFGYKMKAENAAVLGLLPPALTHKTKAVGNAALGGCAKVLLENGLQAAQDLAAAVTEVSLPTHPRFESLFVQYMGF